MDFSSNITAMPHLPTMLWDYQDLLKEVDLGGGGTAYYVYDASGERVRKVIENRDIVEERIYLGDYEIWTKTVNGQITDTRETLHINDGTKRIAILDTEKATSSGTVGTTTSGTTTTIPGSDPGADLGKTTIRYQYDNHLGSASLELDETAEIISYEEYHPFGTTSYRSGRSETETSLKRYKYVGKERDNETGLYYYGARYYAAWLCRFVSVDPMAGKYPELSPYCYVANRPIIAIDPFGADIDIVVNDKTEESRPLIKVTITGKVLDYSTGWGSIGDVNNITETLNEAGSKFDQSNLNVGGLGFQDSKGNDIIYADIIFEFNFEEVNSINDVSPEDHLVVVTEMIDTVIPLYSENENGEMKPLKGEVEGVTNMQGGKVAYIRDDSWDFEQNRTVLHEVLSHFFSTGKTGHEKAKINDLRRSGSMGDNIHPSDIISFLKNRQNINQGDNFEYHGGESFFYSGKGYIQNGGIKIPHIGGASGKIDVNNIVDKEKTMQQ